MVSIRRPVGTYDKGGIRPATLVNVSISLGVLEGLV